MRTPGIEPGAQAWEACMLPLHYERQWHIVRRLIQIHLTVVESMNFSARHARVQIRYKAQQVSLPEWSKGVDSSSTSASCVGSNPTAVILL